MREGSYFAIARPLRHECTLKWKNWPVEPVFVPSKRAWHRLFFFLVIRRQPRSMLFPYTTLFRSNQVVSVGADIAFDADPKFFACLVRFESSSVPTTLPTAYDVYPLDGRHDGGYYTVKDCVTIDVLPRTPGNNVYVGFMVWSNFTATKCRGLVSLNQVIKEIICLQPLK